MGPAVPIQGGRDPEGARAEAALSPLQRAILLTVIYASLFDHPLNEEEIYRDLVAIAPSRLDFHRALESLLGVYLIRSGSTITWAGQEKLAGLRRRRQAQGRKVWPWARRYGRWLAWAPFIRMVAISGSLAVDNVEADADIDGFIITASDRLWIARVWLVLLRLLTHRLTFLFPHAFCPNYIVTLDGLTVERRNLYTAHEIVQAVPLWGESAYQRFIGSNRWVLRYLPQASPTGQRLSFDEPPRPRLTRWAERLLGGRPGDLLDRGLYRLFLLYHRLVRSRQLSRRMEPDPTRRADFRRLYQANVQAAFQPQRQEIVEGGYARTVSQRFTEQARLRLGDALDPAELEALFPSGAAGEPEAGVHPYNSAHHARLFQEHYGRA